jgi:RHS repeat-associated protein
LKETNMKTTKVLAAIMFLIYINQLQAQTTTVYSYAVIAPGGGTGYAANGNVMNYSDSVNGTWSMTYDSLNRLQSANATNGPFQSLSLSMTYDSFGNRLTQTPTGSPPAGAVPTAWAKYNANNQITTSSTDVGGVKYDFSGNLINDGNNQMAYNAENQVCAVYNSIVGGSVTQYLYDAEGRRVAKGHSASNPNQLACSSGGTDFVPTATFVVDQMNEQVTQFDGSGNWQHSNVFAGGGLIATYDTQGPGLHYHISDQLGNRRVQVSSLGVVELNCANLPFGDLPDCTGPGVDATEHHFTGKERDAESGNDYFGARYYGSNMGRFMSPDPTGLYYASSSNPQSLNLYSYVLNNPLINIDPTGTECVWDDGSYDSDGDYWTGEGAVDGSGNHTGCSGQGGTWIDHSYFANGNMADWSGQANSDLAEIVVPSVTVNAGPWDRATFNAYGSMWMAGTLPTNISYGQNDPATLAMVSRPWVQGQLAAYASAGCPASYPAGQESLAAYKESAGDVVSGNPNYVQMEVGGYSGHITTSGGVTTVSISNVSGISSISAYSAGVGSINSTTGSHFNRNALDRTSGAGRNVTQTFTQTMPSPCGGG